MMKKLGVLSLFLVLVSLSFISAQYYGSASIGDILSNIDDSTMVLGVIFVVSALLINMGLTKSRVFGYNNKAFPGVISVALALLIIWAVNKSSWNYYGFFNGVFFFIPESFLETLWPIILLIGIVFFAFKFRWEALLWGGLVLMILGWFVFEEGTILVIIGIGLIVIRILLRMIGIKSHHSYPYSNVPGNVGRGILGGAKGVWRGGVAAKNYIDPRSRLDRYQIKQMMREDKRAASRELRREKKKQKEVYKRWWRRYGHKGLNNPDDQGNERFRGFD